MDSKYTVCANLYSRDANDYIHHFHGQDFQQEEEVHARMFWNKWWPSKSMVEEIVNKWLEENPFDHLEIEIGLWDNETEEDILFLCSKVYDDSGFAYDEGGWS